MKEVISTETVAIILSTGLIFCLGGMVATKIKANKWVGRGLLIGSFLTLTVPVAVIYLF